MPMLCCAYCGTTSADEAWYWIAVLVRVPGGVETAFYCPVCAESEHGYFSKQRTRRLELSEEPQAE